MGYLKVYRPPTLAKQFSNVRCATYIVQFANIYFFNLKLSITYANYSCLKRFPAHKNLYLKIEIPYIRSLIT